jgi:ribosomal protein S18 acetylase RimI-like enzyme
MFITLNKFIKLFFTEKELNKKHYFINKFCENINKEYIKNLVNDKNNKILLYSINNKLSDNYKNEIIGIIIYRIILYNNTKIRIYISLISIHKNMRDMGYGNIIIEEFINKFNKNKIIEFVLLSLPSSYEFYKKIGFEKTNIKYIQKKEIIDNNIMMIKINNILL